MIYNNNCVVKVVPYSYYRFDFRVIKNEWNKTYANDPSNLIINNVYTIKI